MKNRIYLSLALICCLSHNATSMEKMETKEITYEDYKKQRLHIFKFIKTPKETLKLLEKEALRIGIKSKKITDNLKKIKNLEEGINNYGDFLLSLCPCGHPYEPTQKEQDEIEKIKSKTKRTLQLLLHQIHFITEEILNIAACKSLKEINAKEKCKIEEEFKKMDQQKYPNPEELTLQTLELAAQTKTFILTSLIQK